MFDPGIHDRSDFHSGEPLLDAFLSKYAAQQSAKEVTAVFVLVDDAKPSKILGFYTLSASQVDVAQLSPADQKKLPRYSIPCFRLGRQARDMESRRNCIGAILMGLAMDPCRKAMISISAYASLVDAKSTAAKSFCEHYGFFSCADAPMTLYLPLR